jgi:peptidoglycan L-alanyl-D-glutamate endopeptidase CwlK
MNIGALLIVYLLLVSAAMAVVVLPAVRQGAIGWACRGTSGFRQATRGADGAMSGIAASTRTAVQNGARVVSHWQTQHWAVASAMVFALAAPSLLAWWFGAERRLEAYADSTLRPIDAHIAALLQGEQLVTPVPLPPAVFATQALDFERLLITSASREWAALDAGFRQRLLLVFKMMDEKYGYEMTLVEGFRSPARQALLHSRGPSVTRAGAFESYHQLGLAADCAFYRDGQLVVSERDPWARRGYALYGEVAESVGLVWGGRWTSIVDLGHVELPRGGGKRGP